MSSRVPSNGPMNSHQWQGGQGLGPGSVPRPSPSPGFASRSVSDHAMTASTRSTIESNVTRLLVSTKQLLESLPQWARGETTEQDVSDIYVRLGNEFNIACRAFLNAGIDVSDLGDVPQLLREVLERALSDDASQANLDKYLPSIREIVVNLLKQLKQKQAQVKASQQTALANATPISRSGISPVPSVPLPNHPQYPQPPVHGRYQPQQSLPPPRNQMPPPMKYPTRSESLSGPSSPITSLPPRHNSIGGNGGSNSTAGVRSGTGPDASGSIKLGNGVPGFHGRPPPPPPAGTPGQSQAHGLRNTKKNGSRSNLSNISMVNSSSNRFESHRGTQSSSTANSISSRKESSNPLATLQRSEALERRASRRFSAYQFAKLTNSPQATRDAIPDLPPLPNAEDNRPSFLPTTTSHSSAMADYMLSTSVVDDREHKDILPNFEESPQIEERSTSSTSSAPSTPLSAETSRLNATETEPPGPITVFLQVGHKVKKTSIERSEITIASLRLQFVEKFAYSPGSEAFPDVYIQDPKSGIRYELDEVSLDEVRKGGVLVSLNIEETEELNETLKKLEQTVGDLHSKIDENTAAINKIKESSSIPTSVENQPRAETPSSMRPTSKVSLKQIESIRKEVAVVKQVASASLSELKNEVSDILAKTKSLQDTSYLTQNNTFSRAFMEQCHKKLSTVDNLVTNADDLQDIIEAMRKDVAQRGVRHTPRQLETVAKELSTAMEDLEKMSDYIDNETPRWKKVWERELDTVCEEQQFFQLQKDLVRDLKDDLSQAQETFKLVEMCSEEQSKSAGVRRPTQPTILPAPLDGIVHVKDAVLSEVSALKPNHEVRVEAIERAEKLRRKELEIRNKGGEFEEELEDFVGENKLKKSGGIEETERRLKLREQKMLEEQRKNDAEAKILREQDRERRKLERQRQKENPDPISEDNLAPIGTTADLVPGSESDPSVDTADGADEEEKEELSTETSEAAVESQEADSSTENGTPEQSFGRSGESSHVSAETREGAVERQESDDSSKQGALEQNSESGEISHVSTETSEGAIEGQEPNSSAENSELEQNSSEPSENA